MESEDFLIRSSLKNPYFTGQEDVNRGLCMQIGKHVSVFKLCSLEMVGIGAISTFYISKDKH